MDNMLLPLLSIVGSVVGVIAGGIIANHSASHQIQSENLRTFYRDKQSAYSDFIIAYQSFLLTSQKGRLENPESISMDEINESTEFAKKYASALLLAPEEIRQEIESLYLLSIKAANEHRFLQLNAQYGKVLELLHNDLTQTLKI